MDEREIMDTVDKIIRDEIGDPSEDADAVITGVMLVGLFAIPGNEETALAHVTAGQGMNWYAKRGVVTSLNAILEGQDG